MAVNNFSVNVHVDEDVYSDINNKYLDISKKIKECYSLINSDDLTGQLKTYFENNGNASNVLKELSILDEDFEKASKKIIFAVNEYRALDDDIKKYFDSMPIDFYEYIDFVNNNKKKVLSFFDESYKGKSDEEMNEYIARCHYRYFETDKFDDYPLFRYFLLQDKFVSKPHRDSRYATQGCCSVGKFVFLTAYDTQYSTEFGYEMDNAHYNSILEICVEDGRTITIDLGDTAHSGGISYYEKGGKLYICTKDEDTEIAGINIYDIEQLNEQTRSYTAEFSEMNNIDGEHQESLVISPDETFWIEAKEITNASYLTVHDDYLYVGVFAKDKPGKLVRYNLDEDGTIGEQSGSYVPPVDNVQGMCVYNYNGEDYYFFSSSHGRGNDSELCIAKLNENGKFVTYGRFTMPCMSEQVSIDADGNLMLVFESDCCKYGDGLDKDGKKKATKQVGNVVYLDTEKILETTAYVHEHIGDPELMAELAKQIAGNS